MSGSDDIAIVPRAEVGEAAWDAFVAGADEAWLWHRYAFADALATWPRSDDESAAAIFEGRVAAVLPLRRIADRRLRVLRADVLESHGGAAVADDLGPRLRDRVRRALLEHVEAAAATTSTHEIRVALPPLAPAYRGERTPLVNPLIELGLHEATAQTWVVDLAGSESELWEGMEGRARTAVRKAGKEGITVRAATAADLPAYLELHAVTCARTGIRPHPDAYFALLFEWFLPAGHLVVLVAERDGQAIAARTFGAFKDAVNTWTAAGTEGAGRGGANSLLQWEAMRQAQAGGAQWCDCGEAFPGSAAPKEQALSEFKRSFGGGLYPYYRGRRDLRPRALRAVDAAR